MVCSNETYCFLWLVVVKLFDFYGLTLNSKLTNIQIQTFNMSFLQRHYLDRKHGHKFVSS